MTSRGGPVAALVLASALWGGAVVATKYALAGFDPYLLLAVALVSATAVLWVVALARGVRLPRSWRLAVVLGLLEPGGAYLARDGGTFAHQRRGGSHRVRAGVGVRRRPRGAGPEGADHPDHCSGSRARAGRTAWCCKAEIPLAARASGDLYVAAGVLSASTYTVVVKRFSGELDALALTVYQFSAATVLAVGVAGAGLLAGTSRVPTSVAPRLWVTAALIGILGYAAAFLLFNSVIGRIGAGAASVVLNLIPAFGVLFALLLLGEMLKPATGLGALLVAGSVVTFVVMELREPAEQRRICAAGGPSL